MQVCKLLTASQVVKTVAARMLSIIMKLGVIMVMGMTVPMMRNSAVIASVTVAAAKAVTIMMLLLHEPAVHVNPLLHRHDCSIGQCSERRSCSANSNARCSVVLRPGNWLLQASCSPQCSNSSGIDGWRRIACGDAACPACDCSRRRTVC